MSKDKEKQPLCRTCSAYGIFIHEDGIQHSCMCLMNTHHGQRTECEYYINRGEMDYD